MKIHYATLALLAGISVVFSSCAAPYAGYVSYSSHGGGMSTGVAWTNASYDSEGFPIFGYSYGRPVYGYTEAGVAIFTLAALTALSFVPHWGPASWYHGHYRYPSGIHRVAQPPRYPAGHAPHVRPPAGAHRGPGMPAHAVSRPSVSRPAQPALRRPVNNVAPQRPGWTQPGRVGAPQYRQTLPQQPNHRFGVMNRNSVMNRNGVANRNGVQTLPGNRGIGQAASQRAGVANRGEAVTLPAPRNSRPVASVSSFRPANSGAAATGRSFSAGRPSAVSSSFSRGRAGSFMAARGGHSGKR